MLTQAKSTRSQNSSRNRAGTARTPEYNNGDHAAQLAEVELASSPVVLQTAQLMQSVQESPYVAAQQERLEANFTATASDVVQMVKRRGSVTGITHLVSISKEGSIYGGQEVLEVEGGDVVEIDTEVKYRSRRGPNQEIYKDLDESGPSIYRWFQVFKVNNKPVGGGIFIRDDTFHIMAEEGEHEVGPWLIFGTESKTTEQVASAIQAGYRTFDCAESYHNILAVAQALHQSGLARGEYRVIYKFDVSAESPGALRTKLGMVMSLFEGNIDTMIIHNIDVPKAQLQNAWSVLQYFKKAGSVKEIGLGNIRAEHEDLIKDLGPGVDVVENSVASVVENKHLQELIKRMGSRVLYFDVMNTAREIGLTSPAEINALIMYAQSSHKGSQMIASSSDPRRQIENLRNFTAGSAELGEEEYEGIGKIEKWKNTACPVSDRDFTLPPKFKDALTAVYEHTVGMREKILSGQKIKVMNEGILNEWLRQI